MGLLVEDKGIIGGVNQQSAEFRSASQVEEMVNCIPTLDKGLRKRNPSKKETLTYADGSPAIFVFEPNMWTYEYDRGSGNEDLSEYSFSITSQGLQIVNINTGVVFDKRNGLIYKNIGAQNYMLPFGGRMGYSATVVKDTVFLVNKYETPKMEDAIGGALYLRQGYVHIKRIDLIDGYKYGCIIRSENLPTVTISNGTAIKDSEEAAQDLASRINAQGIYNASSSGSIVQITTSKGNSISSVISTDTFGDLASFGWAHSIRSTADLPQSMGMYTALVKIGENDKSSYWLRYNIDRGLWVESHQDGIRQIIRAETMPHSITRTFNSKSGHIEFHVDQHDWDDRLIGDDDTNKVPNFLEEHSNNTIKDIFFFRNRMGLITTSSISMSEVGEYGNFFRTSVSALLDGDRIETSIESKGAVRTEYAVVFEDSVIMFSDKSQFRFEGGAILSPSSYKITEMTNYEVNIGVRPLAMNDRLYFVGTRGDYSVVYEMTISNESTQSSQATDLTAHVQSYVDKDIDRLSGSSINQMLFLTSQTNRDTVFVYKFYDENRQRHQTDWFEWKFNGDIYSAFALGSDFVLLINRKDAVEASDWILGTGEWRMDKQWMGNQPWIMSPASLDSLNQLEKMDIYPQDHDKIFLDNGLTPIEAFVNFGEWMSGTDGNRSAVGTLKFKTVEFSEEEGSDYSLWVTNSAMGTEEIVRHKYIKGRRPMVYGDARNVRVGIHNDQPTGFRINTVSYEGNLTRRSTVR